MDTKATIFDEIERIKAQIEHHDKEAQKYRDMLKLIIEAASGSTYKATPPSGKPEGTFENVIVSMLQDDIPKSTGQVKALYEEATGKKFDMSNFSARMIGLRNKEEPKVKSFKLDGIADNYWARSECFKGSQIKPEFRDKVKKP
jgi:hypothetical protein